MRQFDPNADLATLFSIVAMASPVIPGTAAWQGRGARGPTRSLWRRLMDTVRLWRQRAEGRQQLRTFDDHLLRDIGITRLQAEAEADKPFWRA
jgi:uncharacterized protein YjiS (DUF1127 family)